MNFKFFGFILALLACFSCSKESDLAVVDKLDLKQYAGKWYEIARMPFRFEKNLKCVSATYTIKPDGDVEVWNQGIDEQTGEKSEVKGIAKVPNPKEPAKLKVSFFRPFYGKYWILDLGENYEYALVGHPNREYLWILAREKSMAQEKIDQLLELAKGKGFDISLLEFVKQDCP